MLTLVTGLLDRDAPAPVLPDLSHREREVLALAAEGRTNVSIAGTLFVSVKTVEAHLASTFTKLEIPRTPDANRRVLAVLTFLRATGSVTHRSARSPGGPGNLLKPVVMTLPPGRVARG